MLKVEHSSSEFFLKQWFRLDDSLQGDWEHSGKALFSTSPQQLSGKVFIKTYANYFINSLHPHVMLILF